MISHQLELKCGEISDTGRQRFEITKVSIAFMQFGSYSYHQENIMLHINQNFYTRGIREFRMLLTPPKSHP